LILNCLFILTGTSYISTIIFAAISDAKLGRAKTIIIGKLKQNFIVVLIMIFLNDRFYSVFYWLYDDHLNCK
jgi:hypothetical protein